MPDQILLYDTAVRQWVLDIFENIVAGKDFYLMVGTPDRGFAEYVTPSGSAPMGRAPLPRAALTLGDPEIDDSRHNPNVLRKLGYSANNPLQIRRANYPTAINLRYTLNFWCEYIREMNLYMATLLEQFRSQVKYIKVDLDTISPEPGIYGIKDVGLYKEGSIVDTGSIEPGGNERVLRRTFDFHLKAWLWDLNVTTKPEVREFGVEWYRDKDLSLLLRSASTPQRDRNLFTGDGSEVSFSGTLFRTPVVEKTFLLDVIIDGTPVRVRDDGDGTLIDPNNNVVSGVIDYETGEIEITFTVAPDDQTEMSAAYYNTID